MNISLELYKVFYTVAKHKNITKASKELLISQPAISKSIKNLEQQLGGNLFVRTKRGVKLTEEGQKLRKMLTAFRICGVATVCLICSHVARTPNRSFSSL